jgi:hypothetical protein
MALTWDDVVAVAPELSATPEESQTALLGYATAQVEPTVWGDLTNNGIVYLAAHLATLARLRGGGMVTSERVGALARTYQTSKAGDGALELTSYGAEYRRLLKLLAVAVGAVY